MCLAAIVNERLVMCFENRGIAVIVCVFAVRLEVFNVYVFCLAGFGLCVSIL